MWSDEHTNWFPNVDGDNTRSILAASNELQGMLVEVLPNYKYVPGLRPDDPGALIFFYVNQPTRWRVHIQPKSVFTKKSWLVVPLDYQNMERRQVVAHGEQSENISTEQFTNRLIATLAFLRTNDRPNWQAIVKEHTTFVESVALKQ